MRILKQACNNGDRKTIEEYLKWILKVDVEAASEVFKELPEQLIPPDDMKK